MWQQCAPCVPQLRSVHVYDLLSQDAPPADAGGVLRFTLNLDMQTESGNTYLRKHWAVRKKAQTAWKLRVLKALLGVRPAAPLERVRLEVARYSSGGGLDWDNALSGMKPVFDCLVMPSERNPDGLGIIRDDNPSVVPVCPVVTQHPAKPGAGRLVVKIYELPAAPVAPATVKPKKAKAKSKAKRV